MCLWCRYASDILCEPLSPGLDSVKLTKQRVELQSHQRLLSLDRLDLFSVLRNLGKDGHEVYALIKVPQYMIKNGDAISYRYTVVEKGNTENKEDEFYYINGKNSENLRKILLSPDRQKKGSSLSDASSHIQDSLNIGEPLASSSPTRCSNTTNAPKSGETRQHSLRMLNMNCQSIKNKRNELQVLIESSTPDIIFGTESWMSDNVHTSEIFPPELGYDVIRRDRHGDAHGGVFIAAKVNLGLNLVHKSKHVELITGSFNTSPNKKTLTTCFYRPSNMSTGYNQTAIKELNDLRTSHKNTPFILAGDFNLPNISWPNYSIKGSQNFRDTNMAYIQMAADLSIQQEVDQPTRGTNILDLIFTSHPGHLNRCRTLPPLGNSDHDIVLIDVLTQVYRPQPKRRTIYLWKKANIANIRQSLDQQYNTFCCTEFNDVNNTWSSMRRAITGAIQKHVPAKRTLDKHTHTPG
ncbi:hypothetical protein FSP39_005202 [Pinctada imbricata]|uniref:Endonuclease/exonuclease/phosphatase domain-containing protein n=1 Tax=Pinctada imbricata TaxID=66713 RepID=A0AA88Y381_PINIB|nr:hypothetical protein FSP39_005202 [Pinctada imbricata]